VLCVFFPCAGKNLTHFFQLQEEVFQSKNLEEIQPGGPKPAQGKFNKRRELV
jgi:hypothetical protein